jgi:hypothetical protein
MSEEQTFNAADPSQVKEAAKKMKKGDDRHKDDVRRLLALDYGRRILWQLMSRCGVFKADCPINSGELYFKEGQRNVGLMILTDITQADPDAYLQMMKEAKDNE